MEDKCKGIVTLFSQGDKFKSETLVPVFYPSKKNGLHFDMLFGKNWRWNVGRKIDAEKVGFSIKIFKKIHKEYIRINVASLEKNRFSEKGECMQTSVFMQ